MTNVYQRKVQYYETDGMRIVHHSNYIRYFEEARIDYLERLGVFYGEIEKAGYIVPVLSVSADYKSPAVFGETLAVSVCFEECGGIRFAFCYQIHDVASGALRAVGKTTHCLLKDGKPVSLKRELPRLYETMADSKA